MFENFLTWREQNNVDSILDRFEFPEYQVCRKYYPRLYYKTDNFGRPVYIERIGKVNITKLWQSTTVDRIMENHIYEYEKLIRYRLKAASASKGSLVSKTVTILDMAGVSLSGFSSVFSLISKVSAIAQDYYPEILGLPTLTPGRMFIVNAPYLFYAVWSMCSPLLNEVTVKKISILGSNYLSELKVLIKIENIPDFLGGNAVEDWDNVDKGPWNDQTVEGYPIVEMEKVIMFFKYRSLLQNIKRDWKRHCFFGILIKGVVLRLINIF